MNSRLLEYFLVVAKERNISKAANLLHITQPTLSRQMKLLEEEVGTELFQRSNHHIILTREGVLFEQRCKELLRLWDQMVNEINPKSEDLEGTISIGIAESYMSHIVAATIKRFQEKHSKVKFEIHKLSNEVILRAMDRGIIDIGCFLTSFETPMYEEKFMADLKHWGVWVPVDSDLALRDVIRPGDMIGYSIITYRPNTEVQLRLVEWAGESARYMDYSASYDDVYVGLAMGAEMNIPVVGVSVNANYPQMQFKPLEPSLKVESSWRWKHIDVYRDVVQQFIKFLKVSYDDISMDEKYTLSNKKEDIK